MLDAGNQIRGGGECAPVSDSVRCALDHDLRAGLGGEPTGRDQRTRPRNRQILWIKVCQATSDTGVSGDGSGVISTGRSRSLPLWNSAPARTNATRCGAFTARQRAWAASISL